MTITFTPSASGVTLDETGGLQFNGSAANTVPATDNDDKDVSLADLAAQKAALNTELFTTLALSSTFSSANGLAHGTLGTATSTTPITAITPLFTAGASSGLFTTDGKELFLYGTAFDPNLVLLRKADGSGNPDPNGAVAAAVYLDVSVDGTSTSEDIDAWIVQFAALKSPVTTNPDDTITLANLSVSVFASLEFDFAGAPSGQNYFMLFGKQTGALLVSGGNPVDDTTNTNISTGDTVNTSQGGGATTLGVNNQMVDVGEGMHFRFVTLATTDFLVPNLTQNEADVEANTAANGFINTTGASIQFVQTQPGGGAGQYFTVKLTAYSADKSATLETGTHFGEELDNDTPVNILSAGVQVIRGGVNVAGTDPPGSAPPVNVSVVGGVLTVSGLKSGDELFYTTAANHNHVFVQSVSGASFDIGGFSILQAEQTPFAINNIKFDDAGPSITTTGTEPTATVDETDLTTNATADFSGNFISSYGTDGAGSLVYSLGISASGADSGLVDTATNHSVFLFLESGSVVGREGTNSSTAASGSIVFTVTLNSATGVITLDQQRAIVHPNTANPDDSKTLSADTLITLTATKTDGDGDPATATLNIAQNLIFKDDGPSIQTTGTEPTATVDETTLATNATADFSANFTSSFGADGAGTLLYSLGISASGANSGLVDTATNNSVFLFLESGVVVGREGTSAATAVGGNIVFTASVNSTSGVVTLDQQRAIVHPNPADPDDSKTLAADTLITLTATKTDKDGDTAAATLNIAQNLIFEDDGPSIATAGTEPTATVDETVLATNATANFSVNFTSSFGADGAGTLLYSLGISAVGANSGLVDTATNNSVFLFLESGVVVGREGTSAATAVGGNIVFTASVNSTSGVVTLDQQRAIVHPNPADPDDSKTLAADTLITLTATKTDKDGDSATATLNIAQNLNFEDDGPSIATTGTEPTVTVDETVLATDATAGFSVNFTSSFGADGAGTLTYALGVSAPGGVNSGLVDTATNHSVFLFLESGTVVGREGTSAANAVGGNIVFVVSVNGSGVVTLDEQRAIVHPNASDPDDSKSLVADNLITLTATKTDKDGDSASAALNIGQNLIFEDDGPTITAPFDADPGTPGIQTPEKLGNAVGQTASGVFGYDIGSDAHLAAFYAAGGSDFVDTNGNLTGVQINLTGTVDNAQNPNITNSEVTLQSESLTSASFNFSFHYDKDPLTAGVQDATAGGTLVFNKTADTYTFTLNDVIDGFTFDVLHTAELIAKQPTGNTGHPQIVAEQLTPNGDPNPFFVQFTANSTTQAIGFGFNSTGDGAPSGPPTDVSFTQGAHDLVTNVNEDWVSATQDTNGVAGDTIQKGELLTLRFFQENILSDVDPNAPGGGTERLDPTTSAAGVVIKFDGIGNSEDLVVILDLKDAIGNEVTRAVNVENSDLIKGANVPAPYNTEFTLDNNDALLIIEQNDYTVAGETYQIQGIQIMQSANGLTGNAINLNGASGANGGSSATSNLTAWDPTDNDVLKIVDIGFVQQTNATIDANLDFSFALADADFDPTATQHMLVNVSNNWIV